MEHGSVIVRFSDVTFGYDEKHLLMEEASFSVREGAKITIMGQNGAGKSTIFKMITGELKPLKGQVHITNGASIAQQKQVMAKEYLPLTIREYFETAFPEEKVYDIDKRIKDVLEVVNLEIGLDRKIEKCSGGQQARLLLAYALIQRPDILLLDEPTNNLDIEGIWHLTGFLMAYEKTCIVISHDANFLNSFTHGVLHLDARRKKVDQYVGDYLDVVNEIAAQVERDRMKNARLLKEIQDKKDKVNFFANKGGKMRKLAAKLREDIDEAEEGMVDVRQEDRTLGEFEIEAQDFPQPILTLTSVDLLKQNKPIVRELDLKIRKNTHVLLTGPNGIGKSTLLHAIATGTANGSVIAEGVRVGYYRQDFSGLDVSKTAFQILTETGDGHPDQEEVYETAARFLLPSRLLHNPVSTLSEGQKGLLCYAQFFLLKPGLLILDEPTNHINFRHLPVIAKALSAYQGAMLLVSHVQEFVDEIRIDETIDLQKMIERE